MKTKIVHLYCLKKKKEYPSQHNKYFTLGHIGVLSKRMGCLGPNPSSEEY